MKVLLGPLVGRASGKVGGMVASSNRYGTYFRRNAKPTISTTSYAQAIKSQFALVSQAWQDLSSAQREAWRVWAANNPVVDRLGEKQVLAGNAAFCRVNTLLAHFGSTILDVPPTGAGPVSLTSLTLSGDIGAGNFQAAYTATPVAAGVKLLLWACVVDGAGVRYVRNKMRLIGASSAAQASPWDYQADVIARLGTLQVGQIFHARLVPWDSATGLLALGTESSVAITETA